VDAQASVVETYIGEGWINRLSHFTLYRGARLMLSRRLLGTAAMSASPIAPRSAKARASSSPRLRPAAPMPV
jgi:hypothetical protein